MIIIHAINVNVDDRNVTTEKSGVDLYLKCIFDILCKLKEEEMKFDVLSL